MDPKISVVVSVYKIEKFIAACLESILSQDFDAFEVIAVDDGSPDASGAICDDFAHRDPRLTVIHKENGGSTAARKTGVERARGEWIYVVDGDDVLLPHALSALYAATQKFPEADIIEGSHFAFRDDINAPFPRKNDPFPPSREPLVVDAFRYAKEIATFQQAIFASMPWRKIFRREALLKAHAFDVPREIVWGNSPIMSLRAATEARCVVRIPDRVYAYRLSDTGVTRDKESRTRFLKPDFSLLWWRSVKESFVGKSENWQDIGRLFIANTLFFRFLNASKTFLRNAEVREYLHDLAAARKRMPKKERFEVTVMLACTKFPLSCIPEAFWRISGAIAKRYYVPFIRFFRRLERRSR